jgi:hypothetical protein
VKGEETQAGGDIGQHSGDRKQSESSPVDKAVNINTSVIISSQIRVRSRDYVFATGDDMGMVNIYGDQPLIHSICVGWTCNPTDSGVSPKAEVSPGSDSLCTHC